MNFRLVQAPAFGHAELWGAVAIGRLIGLIWHCASSSLPNGSARGFAHDLLGHARLGKGQ